MAAVCDLVSGLDAELVRLGYKPSTMVWYRGCWRRLERYFASRGAQEFSLDVAMSWVDEACGGFFEKEQAGTLKPTDVYLFRVAQMLNDFAVHGAVLRRYSRSVSKLSAEHADISPGSRGGCGRMAARSRQSGRMARSPGSFSRSLAGAAGWPGWTAGWSARSSRRWLDIGQRRWSTSCARCARFAVRRSWRAYRPGCAGGGPGGQVGQTGEDPVGGTRPM